MGAFHDANYNITKIRTSNGDIAELELNGKSVALASDVKIEEEKEVTIKVSEYTEPIEIVPTSGKDGIAKVVITLDTSEEAGD